MKRRIVIERAAEEDLLEITTFIREDRPSAALRFVAATKEAFSQLSDYPHMGSHMGSGYLSDHPKLQNVRLRPIKGFDRYLIFYRADSKTVFIERVLYSGRDLNILLED